MEVPVNWRKLDEGVKTVAVDHPSDWIT